MAPETPLDLTVFALGLATALGGVYLYAVVMAAKDTARILGEQRRLKEWDNYEKNTGEYSPANRREQYVWPPPVPASFFQPTLVRADTPGVVRPPSHLVRVPSPGKKMRR